SVIGPYDEGAQLSLNCIVTGGRPRPEVSWWLDNKLVDHTFIGTSENVVQNVLVIPQLQRHHLHAILRCQASTILVRATPRQRPILASIPTDITIDNNKTRSSPACNLISIVSLSFFFFQFQLPILTLIFYGLFCCKSHRMVHYPSLV
ncbi:Uncharacterized protein APZ42_007378, partial [Daphnia magna]